MIIDNVKINCNIEISEAEARTYLTMQKEFNSGNLKELDIKIKDDDVVIAPHYDTVVRLRRITGYLSNVKNFNGAKKQEASDRVKHI